MTDHHNIAEGVSYVAKVGPPLGVTGASFLGMPLSDWVYITTIAYTLLQTGYFLWKLMRKDEAENGSD
jgi:hypothetical protein